MVSPYWSKWTKLNGEKYNHSLIWKKYELNLNNFIWLFLILVSIFTGEIESAFKTNSWNCLCHSIRARWHFVPRSHTRFSKDNWYILRLLGWLWRHWIGPAFDALWNSARVYGKIALCETRFFSRQWNVLPVRHKEGEWSFRANCYNQNIHCSCVGWFNIIPPSKTAS